MMASEIAKKTGLIRTNTYDILSTLIKKGVVAYVIRNGKKYFRAAEPEKLIDYVESQQKDLDELKYEINKILPQLNPVKDIPNRPVIEIYEWREGFKTILEM